MLALSLVISAQNIEKKCKTCGKVLSACSYHGRHPNKPQKPIANKPSNRISSNKPQEPKPYIERTETKQPGEEYEIRGKFGSSGLALVKLRGKYGFINKEGKEVIPLKYDNIYCKGYFSNMTGSGWSSTEYLMSVSQNNKWGFINQKGELVIPIIYSQVQSYVYADDNFILCKKEGKWGAIGQDMCTKIPFEYEELGGFYNGHPCKAKKEGKYGFINEKNDIIVPFNYSSTRGFPYHGSLAQVCKNGKYGYVDLQGKEAISIKFDFASDFDFLSDEKVEDAIAGVIINNKLGFINGRGENVIPCQYEYEFSSDGDGKCLSHQFWGARCLVKKNGKWGVIDRKGTIIVPFIYDGCNSSSSSGTFDLIKDGKPVYVDKDGNTYDSKGERDTKKR